MVALPLRVHWPRQELVAELAAACGGAQLFMMRPTDLLRRAGTLKVAVRAESVDEAERVGREAARSTWSLAGVVALLERLEEEGWEQALVIRVAAARGGRIGREEIYDICGYGGDRMLRGFAKPTARITRDLQDAGLVAPDVGAALAPISVGGVAVAYRIPAEMVAILADVKSNPTATDRWRRRRNTRQP